MNFGKCEQLVKHSKIVLRENRSTMVFNNPGRKKVRKILIDDCVITNGSRCDFLLITDDSTEHFVELKGSDVEHALVQLVSTIKQTSTDPYNSMKLSFIVCTRHPALTPKIQKIKLTLKRKFNCLLITKGILCHFDI